ncbi:hypothetical protein AB0A05_26985 [Streptomyces sp. NPDC046374]|uniref:hypothetical protein n=1 Tax=Streptomyces sp. NPDC046374 TaxID=3154917 RepID=UPI00340454DF
MTDTTERTLWIERSVHGCHESMTSNHQSAVADLQVLVKAADLEMPETVEMAITGHRAAETDAWTDLEEGDELPENVAYVRVRWSATLRIPAGTQ